MAAVSGRMAIAKAREYFDVVAARGRDLRLADATGTWQFDVDGLGSWSVKVDRGVFSVAQEPVEQPTVRVELSEPELIRLALGEEHENLFTALLRGAVRWQGDFRFAQKMQAILPMPDEWRAGS